MRVETFVDIYYLLTHLFPFHKMFFKYGRQKAVKWDFLLNLFPKTLLVSVRIRKASFVTFKKCEYLVCILSHFFL